MSCDCVPFISFANKSLSFMSPSFRQDGNLHEHLQIFARWRGMPQAIDVSVGVYVPERVNISQPLNVIMYKSGWASDSRTDSILNARQKFHTNQWPYTTYSPNKFPQLIDFVKGNDILVDIPVSAPFPSSIFGYEANGAEYIHNPFHAGSSYLHVAVLDHFKVKYKLQIRSVVFSGTSNGAVSTICSPFNTFSGTPFTSSLRVTRTIDYGHLPHTTIRNTSLLPWLNENANGLDFISKVQEAGYSVRSLILFSTGCMLPIDHRSSLSKVIKGATDGFTQFPRLKIPVPTFIFMDDDDPYVPLYQSSTDNELARGYIAYSMPITRYVPAFAKRVLNTTNEYIKSYTKDYDYDYQWKNYNGFGQGRVKIKEHIYKSEDETCELVLLRFEGNKKALQNFGQHGPSSIADLYGNLKPAQCFYQKHVYGQDCTNNIWFTWSGSYTNNADASTAAIDVQRLQHTAESEELPETLTIRSRGFTDDKHYFQVGTYGGIISSVVSQFDVLHDDLDMSKSNVSTVDPIIDVSGSHGESTFARVDVLDKRTLKIVASKTMIKMWTEYMGENVDEFGTKYPRPADWDIPDIHGNPTIIDQGPFATTVTIAQGHPEDKHAKDFLYMYNGNWHHLTIAKVRKADLKIVYAKELHGGKIDGLANLWWGKGITVLKANPTHSDPRRRLPRVIVHTSAHVLYETYYNSLVSKQPYFPRLNPGAIKPNHNTSGMIFCFIDTGDELKLEWEFPISPRNLQSGEVLPSTVFPQDIIDANGAYRIMYGISNLKELSQKSCVTYEGWQRVVLKPKWHDAYVSNVNGIVTRRQWPVWYTTKNNKLGALRGYIQMQEQIQSYHILYRPFFKGQTISCYKKDEIIDWFDDDFRVGENDCVEISMEYLSHINAPIVLGLKASCIGTLILDEQMAHGLNFRGSGGWFHTFTWDEDTDTLYGTTSSYDFIPLEEQIRSMRARNAVPQNTGVIAGMGMKDNLFVDSTRFSVDTKDDDIWYVNEKYTQSRDEEELYRFGTETQYLLYRNLYKNQLDNEFLFKLYKDRVIKFEQTIVQSSEMNMSPRARRFLGGGGMYAVQASTGKLLWGKSETNGLNGYFRTGTHTSDEVFGESYLFACGRSNLDNSAGIVSYRTKTTNNTMVKRGITGLQKSDIMFALDLEKQVSSDNVPGDSSPQKLEGVLDHPLPLLLTDQPLGDIDAKRPNIVGKMRGIDGISDALRNKWGIAASNGKYVVSANIYNFALSEKNNLLHMWNGTHHVPKYDNLKKDEIPLDPLYKYHGLRAIDLEGTIHIGWNQKGLGYRHEDSATFIMLTVRDALTFEKIWDIIYVEPSVPVRKYASSLSTIAFLHSDIVTFSDFTNNVKFVNVVTGATEKVISLDDMKDSGDLLGPVIDEGSLLFVKMKASVFGKYDLIPLNQSANLEELRPTVLKVSNPINEEEYKTAPISYTPAPPPAPFPPRPPPRPIGYSGST